MTPLDPLQLSFDPAAAMALNVVLANHPFQDRTGFGLTSGDNASYTG
jgi:hypothetical protein